MESISSKQSDQQTERAQTLLLSIPQNNHKLMQKWCSVVARLTTNMMSDMPYELKGHHRNT